MRHRIGKSIRLRNKQRGFISAALGVVLRGSTVRPSFDLPLTNSLIPTSSTGSGTPTYARATTGMVEDFEGVLRTALSGEARFKGARRVRNLMAVRSDGDFSSWSLFTPSGSTSGSTITFTGSGGNDFRYGTAATAVVGNTYRVSCTLMRGTKTGTIVIREASGAVTGSLTVALPATPTRYSFLATGSSAIAGTFGFDNRVGNGGDGIAGTIICDGFQVEDVTGQSNQNPAEYVSVGVLSAPYHGAGVDGVRYFDYLNPCTVLNNVVTE